VPEAPKATAPPGALEDLIHRILKVLSPDRGRFILVRSRDRVASAALIEEVLARRTGNYRLVLHGKDPELPFYRSTAQVPGAGAIVLASYFPGSVDFTARAMNIASSVMTDSPNDLVVKMLWLPP